jgi:hypothetical protein
MLIGSQPLTDHDQATRLVHGPRARNPNWVQLPVYRQEGMVAQFAPGLPAVWCMVAIASMWTPPAPILMPEMVAFFEAYLAGVRAGTTALRESPFAADRRHRPGAFSPCWTALTAQRPRTCSPSRARSPAPSPFAPA